MRLGINATGLYPGKVGGAEQYLRNIVSELMRYDDIETYLFLNDDALSTFQENDHLKTIRIDLNYNHYAQLKGYIHFYQLDVWFCPFFHLIPVDCEIPNATTIFDIQQEYFPENFDKKVLNDRKRMTEDTVKHTDLILTISNYSKQTLIDTYSIPSERIKVTYLDADSSFNLPIDSRKLERIRKTLPDHFILFPANMWPHKNHINLIKGLVIAKEKYSLPLDLVFTGAQERETEQITQVIESVGMRDHVKYLGYLPQDDMRYVFQCADMLAFPSFFEGFGIPLIEAMVSEIPIICSTSSCVPEIAGDAAFLFDGYSPDEIAEAINQVFTNEDLQRELISKGKERRKLFSWEKCAQDTVEYLRALYVPRKPVPPRFSNHPKVSVITPSYNQGEFIRDTIESVLNQTYDNVEYIVMDGGSTDETVSILKEYGDRIKWVSEKDGGQADAVNKGLAVADGEIIGWLNSDDTYYPKAIETAVEVLLSHPDVDMVYGEGDYIDKNGDITGRYNTKMFDYNELANECFICQPTAFFTKEVADRVGGLNAELQLCMDYEFWMRIGKEGQILYIPERMATSRMYEDNKTLSRRAEVYKECCKEIKRHYGFVPHSWIMGYATYEAQVHHSRTRKYHYLYLFLRYNYTRPDYFMQCFKQYIRLKRNGKQAKKAAALAAKLPPPTNEWFPDGWISEQYKTTRLCQGNENELLITGKHLLPFEVPLLLTVETEGIRKTFCLRDYGDFSLVLHIPSMAKGKHLVKITASQTIIPALLGSSSDNRKLSVQIDTIVFRYKEYSSPLVSIITPSYNQAEFLRDTIESVLGQDYENLEYVVIDGGSTDGSLDILKEYEGRLRYVSEPDNGQSNALNKGFKMAKGDIVAWLNSDDVYEPGAIKKAVDAFSSNANVGLVYGDGYIIDREGTKLRPFEFSRNFNLWALIHIWDYIMQPAAFFRADALKAVGYLDERLNWTMDWDLWIKLAYQCEVVHIQDYLACSREYEQTKTSTGTEKRLEEILHIMQRYSGEEVPFGYDIYYCSELLAHCQMEDFKNKELRDRLAKLLILQPTPDNEDRCTAEVNFLVRPYSACPELEVEVLKECKIPISFSCNGVQFEKRVFTQGISYVHLPLAVSKNIILIHADIDSDELRNIGNQSDSWVKMRLVD